MACTDQLHTFLLFFSRITLGATIHLLYKFNGEVGCALTAKPTEVIDEPIFLISKLCRCGVTKTSLRKLYGCELKHLMSI